MCARKPAQLHKQPSNLSSTSFQNHHHHLATSVVVQLISTSLVTRLETLRKHRRQLSPIPRINLRQVWAPRVNSKPTNNNNIMDMSNEINENLSNEIAEVKGCLHQNNFFPSTTCSPSLKISSSNIQVLRDQNS